MTQRNLGRLAIHRRSDEIAFLQSRLRILSAAHPTPEGSEVLNTVFEVPSSASTTQDSGVGRTLRAEVMARERDLADELLHTRQIEPLGETLQRRLAMAERVRRDLAPRNECQRAQSTGQNKAGDQDQRSDVLWVAEVEHQALAEMLKQWLAWLRES